MKHIWEHNWETTYKDDEIQFFLQHAFYMPPFST